MPFCSILQHKLNLLKLITQWTRLSPWSRRRRGHGCEGTAPATSGKGFLFHHTCSLKHQRRTLLLPHKEPVRELYSDDKLHLQLTYAVSRFVSALQNSRTLDSLPNSFTFDISTVISLIASICCSAGFCNFFKVKELRQALELSISELNINTDR